MPRNLLEQIQKAVELAAAHSVEVDALCLTAEDMAMLLSADIRQEQLGIKFSADCIGESAVCGLF
jgi:hypothetical protein